MTETRAAVGPDANPDGTRPVRIGIRTHSGQAPSEVRWRRVEWKAVSLLMFSMHADIGLGIFTLLNKFTPASAIMG